jgi:hypothetical protein
MFLRDRQDSGYHPLNDSKLMKRIINQYLRKYLVVAAIKQRTGGFGGKWKRKVDKQNYELNPLILQTIIRNIKNSLSNLKILRFFN